VGGIAVVSIAVAAIFYLRRRSRAPSARSAGFDTFQPYMDENPRPLSDGGGSVGLLSPSIRTKFSVRVSRSSRCTCVSSCATVLFPYTQDVPNDQTTSSGTLVHTRWTSLVRDLHHRTSDQEATKPICRHHFPRPGDITASPCPLSDLAFEAIARFRAGRTLQYFPSKRFFYHLWLYVNLHLFVH
jgi:hypothetical protein